jgi:hypothetical protein
LLDNQGLTRKFWNIHNNSHERKYALSILRHIAPLPWHLTSDALPISPTIASDTMPPYSISIQRFDGVTELNYGSATQRYTITLTHGAWFSVLERSRRFSIVVNRFYECVCVRVRFTTCISVCCTPFKSSWICVHIIVWRVK